MPEWRRAKRPETSRFEDCVPELPEVEHTRRLLEPMMQGARIVRVDLRRPDLRAPFPPAFADRLHGQTVAQLTRRGKYLLAMLSSGDTLVMHLGMTGEFRIFSSGGAKPNRHDHVAFEMSTPATITFNDPRRFGSMDLLSSADFMAHPVLGSLGPEPLSDEFDAGRARTRLSREADLDQSRALRSASSGRTWQHLRERGAAPRPLVAAPAGLDDSDPLGRPARQRDTSRVIDQSRAARGRRPSRSLRTAHPSSRFRVYDRENGELSPQRLPGENQANHASGQVDVLLPGLSAVKTGHLGGSSV